jgi:acetylornithine deacetylase
MKKVLFELMSGGPQHERMSNVLELLEELVAIDSVNPSLAPGAAGERGIAAFVAGWATRAGLTTQVLEATAGRPSVVVRGGGARGGQTLLLCAHLDTVGLGGVADPLSPCRDGDRLYGRGAYDMKGGLAAALVACRDAAMAGIDGEVVVAAVADEEHSSIGVQEVLEHVRADAAVVTEPTELTVATAHKGFVWVEIEVVGKAAHGSRPHLGVDAILNTGPVLVALTDLNEQLRGRRHPLLGPGTLHGSLISGGREESTIPERCVLTIERRTLPGETVGDVERDVAELLGRCHSADPGLVASSQTILAREPFEVARTAPVVRAVTDAATTVLGRRPELGAVSYWADSAFISAAGIPTALFGPAGEGAHAEVEWVSIASTLACAKTLTAMATSFCR